MFEKLIAKFRIPCEFNIYEQVSLIRDHADYPAWLPMPCWYEHGVYMRKYALPHDLKQCRFLMLVNSQERKELWEKVSNISAVVMGAIFPHYRRNNNIEIDKDAKGTIIFPAHLLHTVPVEFCYDKYCEELKSLPEEFHPITICLYHGCVERGRDKIFKDHGFKVVSAWAGKNSHFAKNFYEILRKYKYSTSNVIGSATFYAVEMGLPFFLFGDAPVITNNGELAYFFPKGTFTHNQIGDCLDAEELFSTGPTKVITKEQREYVDKKIGTHEGLSRKELKRLLIITFLKNSHFFLINFLIDLFRRPKKYLRKIFYKGSAGVR